jgi:GT2 family glycosyltransferase
VAVGYARIAGRAQHVPGLPLVTPNAGLRPIDPSHRPTISVVICTYSETRADSVRTAVESVRRQSRPACEIVVAVDHNPGLQARLHESLSGVMVVPNRGRKGLADTRNAGVRVASGGVIAFMDDDAVADPDWLQSIAAAYQDDPTVLGVGGLVEPVWETARPAWFPPEFDWVVGCTYRGMPRQTQSVRNVHGCNMSFRAETFATAGRFRLGYSCDETEFCIRAARADGRGRILYAPGAVVHHAVPSARATWRYFSSRCFFEGGSKAVLAWLCGNDAGLADERRHLRRVLPRAAAGSLVDAIRCRNPALAGRSAAVIAGVGAATAGYLLARARMPVAAAARGWVPPVTGSTPSAPGDTGSGSSRDRGVR